MERLPTITKYKGEGYAFTDTLKLNGNPIDVTDYTCIFKIEEKLDEDNTDVIITKTNGVGDHSDPTNGTTAFSITSTELDIEPKPYKYKIQWADSTGNVILKAVGNFRIKKDE